MLLIFFGLVLCSIGGTLGVDSSKCLSECFHSSDTWTYGKVGYHCYVNYKEHNFCSPRPQNNIKGTDYFVSPAYSYGMYSGGACNGKCGYFNQNYLWCMNTDLSGWDYCAASDIVEYEPWKDIRSKIKSYVDARTGLSGTCNDIIKKSLAGSSATEILNAVKNENNYVYHMTHGIKAGSSINQVDKIFIPGFNERPETDLTLALSAKIDLNHYNALPTCNDANTLDIISYWNSLNPGKNDSMAHLISATFGGSGDKYNIVPIKFGKIKFNPRSDNCDQGISLWNQIDFSIEQFLKKNQGYVEYNVIANYGNLPVSLRPTHFILQISLKQSNGIPYLNAEYPLNGINTFDVLIYNYD